MLRPPTLPPAPGIPESPPPSSGANPIVAGIAARIGNGAPAGPPAGIELAPVREPPAVADTLPPGAKLYCSPLSVLYNTGSVCFNPDLETIDPDFLPWSLYAPPLFLNVRGFVAPYPLGLWIRYCPDCAFKATQGHLPVFAPAGLPAPATPAIQPAQPREAPPRILPARPAIELVLTDGSTVFASRYWLGEDWLLHFVTLDGLRQAIPLGKLNLQATGSANYERGVTFWIPGWPEPKSKPE